MMYAAALLLSCCAVKPAAADNYLEWSWLGCYYDWGNPRALPTYLGNGMDYTACNAAAVAGGYDTFGLQMNGECWVCNGCDYGMYGPVGDGCSWLGDANRQQVHRYFLPPPPLPRNLSVGWSYVGCFREGPPRMLPSRLDGVYTAASCQAAATANGYDTAALQNGGECWACSGCNYGGFGAAQGCPSNGGPSTNQVYLYIAAPPPPLPPAWASTVSLMPLVLSLTCLDGNGNGLGFYDASCGDIVRDSPVWNPYDWLVRFMRCGETDPRFACRSACERPSHAPRSHRAIAETIRRDVQVFAARVHHQNELRQLGRLDARRARVYAAVQHHQLLHCRGGHHGAAKLQLQQLDPGRRMHLRSAHHQQPSTSTAIDH